MGVENALSNKKMEKILNRRPMNKKNNVSQSVQLAPFTANELVSPSDDENDCEDEMKGAKLTMSGDDEEEYIVSDPSDDDRDCLEHTMTMNQPHVIRKHTATMNSYIDYLD